MQKMFFKQKYSFQMVFLTLEVFTRLLNCLYQSQTRSGVGRYGMSWQLCLTLGKAWRVRILGGYAFRFRALTHVHITCHPSVSFYRTQKQQPRTRKTRFKFCRKNYPELQGAKCGLLMSSWVSEERKITLISMSI